MPFEAEIFTIVHELEYEHAGSGAQKTVPSWPTVIEPYGVETPLFEEQKADERCLFILIFDSFCWSKDIE